MNTQNQSQFDHHSDHALNHDYATTEELYQTANTICPAAAKTLRLMRNGDGISFEDSVAHNELMAVGFVKKTDDGLLVFTEDGEAAADMIWG